MRMRSTSPTPSIKTNNVGLADRVLLCIPRGGLNDTLCQIEKCWRYAQQFDRQLVIDARRSGLMGQFFDFFVTTPEDVRVVGRVTSHHIAAFNWLDCCPTELRGRLETYTTIQRLGPSGTKILDAESEVPVSFDFSRDHPHPLLVHEQVGGGKLSFDLLNRLILADDILPDVIERLSTLPAEYLGVHVRNTDLKTDYEKFLQDIRRLTIGRTVLICSDDTNVITRAETILDQSKIVTTGGSRIEFKLSDDQPVHLSGEFLNDHAKREQTIALLVDLLALGRARDVFIAKCSNKDGYSGFSSLASYLCRNQHVVASLLSCSLTMSLDQVRAYVRERDRERTQYTSQRVKLLNRLQTLERKLADCSRTMETMRNSLSWRVTVPLRYIRTQLKR